MDRLNRSEIVFKILSYILIGAFAVMALYPVIYAFSASISGKMAYEAGQVILLPKNINFQVYEIVYNDKAFWIAYVNTLFYTVYGTAWSMFVSTVGAYALSKRNLLFRRQFNFLIVFTIELQPGEVPEHQRIALIRPNVPWRPQRAIDGDHHYRKPVIAGDHNVLGHVGQAIGRACRERPRAAHRRAHRDGHRAVFAFHRHDTPFAEREPGHELHDLGLRGDWIDAARDAPGRAVGLAGDT